VLHGATTAESRQCFFLFIFSRLTFGVLWHSVATKPAMKTMLRKLEKDAILRARCDSRLKQNVGRVALLQQLDESDIIRIACAAYVQKFVPANPFGN
jgi:hypothetical protein